MHRWYSGFHILKIERSFRRYAMLCEVVVEGASKESAVDEEVERDRLLVL